MNLAAHIRALSAAGLSRDDIFAKLRAEGHHIDGQRIDNALAAKPDARLLAVDAAITRILRTGDVATVGLLVARGFSSGTASAALERWERDGRLVERTGKMRMREWVAA